MAAHRAPRRARLRSTGWRRSACLVVLPVAGAVLGSIALAGPGAVAGTTITSPVTVATSNWYWNKTAQIPPQVPMPVSLPDTDVPIPDGVVIPAGDLAVSYRGDVSGDPDRETYLTFTLGGATPGATVKAFTFTIAIDQKNTTNLKSGTIPLIACFPSRAWEAGPGSSKYSDKPMDDCNGAPAGKYDAAKQTYTFDVTSFAQEWADGTNIGVAIRQAKSQVTPFILAFTGPKTVTGSITYTLAAVTSTVPAVAGSIGTTVSDATGAGVGTTTSTVGGEIPPVPTAPMPGVNVAPATLTPAGGTHAIGSVSFDSNFWLSALVGLIAVGLLALFVRRRPVPVRVSAVHLSRLSQVLGTRAAAKLPSVSGR